MREAVACIINMRKNSARITGNKIAATIARYDCVPTENQSACRFWSARDALRIGRGEVTPDSHPIFSRTPVGGFHVVAGFSGHGFMHGPVAGKLMTELILDGSFKTVDVMALDLARFDGDRLIQEYNVV